MPRFFADMKILPLKDEIERMILSAALNSPESFIPLTSLCRPEFFSAENRKILEVLGSIPNYTKESLIEVLSLMVKNKINLKKIHDLINLQCTANMVLARGYYATLLDLHLQIKATELAREFIADSRERRFYEEDLAEYAAKFTSFAQYMPDIPSRIKSFTENLPGIIERLNADNESTGNIYLRGFPKISEMTAGFRAGNLTGIAGSYKSGKTTLALNFACDLAEQNIPVLFFSLEVTSVELENKILSLRTGEQYSKFRNPALLTDDAHGKIKSLIDSGDKYPLYYMTGRMDELRIGQKIRELKARYGIKAVFIDYLGYIESSVKFDSHYQTVEYLTANLKQMAIATETTVFLIAQLNRDGKNSPTSDKLAGSISLARDCDFLFTIYNPVESGISSAPGARKYSPDEYVCQLAESRHTQRNRAALLSLGHSGKFTEKPV